MSERLGRRLAGRARRQIGEKLAAQGLLAGSEDNAPPQSTRCWRCAGRSSSPIRGSRGAITRAVRAPLPPVAAAPGAGRLPRGLLVRADPQGRRGARPRRRSATRSCCCSCSASRSRRRPSTRSATPRRAATAAAARAGWAPASTSSGPRSTRTSPTPTGCRGGRLRTDLGGIYFNAFVAVVTLGDLARDGRRRAPAADRDPDARDRQEPLAGDPADGYHILSDATGVPDLYAHMGPTLKRLLPWKKHEPSALKGWAAPSSRCGC